jgi:hypothetical protein
LLQRIRDTVPCSRRRCQSAGASVVEIASDCNLGLPEPRRAMPAMSSAVPCDTALGVNVPMSTDTGTIALGARPARRNSVALSNRSNRGRSFRPGSRRSARRSRHRRDSGRRRWSTNSTQIDVGGATSYTVTGLAAARMYYFTVPARNAAGILSAPAAEVMGTTLEFRRLHRTPVTSTTMTSRTCCSRVQQATCTRGT